MYIYIYIYIYISVEYTPPAPPAPPAPLATSRTLSNAPRFMVLWLLWCHEGMSAPPPSPARIFCRPCHPFLVGMEQKTLTEVAVDAPKGRPGLSEQRHYWGCAGSQLNDLFLSKTSFCDGAPLCKCASWASHKRFCVHNMCAADVAGVTLRSCRSPPQSIHTTVCLACCAIFHLR